MSDEVEEIEEQPGPTTLRTQTVFAASLHRCDLDPATVYFVPYEESGPATSLRLDREVWRDMGVPAVVTVTVEVGDRLNCEKERLNPPLIPVEETVTVCLFGWAANQQAPSCNYTGGHYCIREIGHGGRCRCVCDATTTLRHD